jgi:hypothetical protein
VNSCLLYMVQMIRMRGSSVRKSREVNGCTCKVLNYIIMIDR